MGELRWTRIEGRYRMGAISMASVMSLLSLVWLPTMLRGDSFTPPWFSPSMIGVMQSVWVVPILVLIQARRLGERWQAAAVPPTLVLDQARVEMTKGLLSALFGVGVRFEVVETGTKYIMRTIIRVTSVGEPGGLRIEFARIFDGQLPPCTFEIRQRSSSPPPGSAHYWVRIAETVNEELREHAAKAAAGDSLTPDATP